MDELMHFASQLFLPENEESIVIPLCLRLQYFDASLPVDPTEVLSSVPDEGIFQYEGRRGDLELLHPCEEDPTVTKYRALFLPDVKFDRYRRAFLLTRNGQEDWLPDSLETLAEKMVSEGRHDQASVLRSGRDLLQEHSTCCGARMYPESCTREEAWAIFRTVLQDAGYYLSMLELRFLAAMWRSRLYVYQRDAHTTEVRLQEVMGSALDPTPFPQDVHVVLRLQEGSNRGHYSRLFQDSAWKEHEERFEGDDEDPFYDSSASEESSTDDGEDALLCRPCSSDLGSRLWNSRSCQRSLRQPVVDETGASSKAPAKATAKSAKAVEDEDEDAFSDISDNSDIFHVEAVSSEVPRTREDEELAIVESIVPDLREFPLLPVDGRTRSKDQSYTDLHSGARLPLLHCGFKGCAWHSNVLPEWHWSMERALSIHLQEKHRDSEMQRVPADAWKKPRDYNYNMDALAYYTAAVCLKEQEHVPLIGPSLDRRMLALLTKVASSENVQSLVCFACAQIHTHVRSWTRMYRSETWRSNVNYAPIRMYSVGESLLQHEQMDSHAFHLNFDLATFRKRYASDDEMQGNPFANATELESGQTEWQRRLLFSEKNTSVWILCCPEDVVRGQNCPWRTQTTSRASVVAPPSSP